MRDETTKTMIDSSDPNEPQETEAGAAPEWPRGLLPVPEFDERKLQLQLVCEVVFVVFRKRTCGDLVDELCGLQVSVMQRGRQLVRTSRVVIQ